MTPIPSFDLPSLNEAADTSAPAKPFRERVRYAPAILAASAVLGVMTRWAFEGSLGLGFCLWVAAVLVAFAAVGGREAVQQAKGAWSWAVAALFFAAWVVIRAAPMLTFFNVVAALGLLGLAARDALGSQRRGRLLDFVWAFFETSLGASKGSAAMMYEAASLANGLKGRAPGSLGAVLRGVMIAAPIVAVMGALLMSGDAHFSALFDGAFVALPDVLASSLNWAVWSLLSAIVLAGALSYALRRAEHSTKTAKTLKKLGATEAMVVLGSIAGLFATFLSVQMTWLFSEDPSQPGTGLTYAHYARQGFFELTVVAGITWWLVEFSRRRVAAEAESKADLALRVLASIVLIQGCVILLSAHTRLALYDEAYSFTLTRIYAHAGIVFLGLCLAIRLVTMWALKQSTAEFAFAAGLCVLAGLNVMNPDAFVVRANLSHHDESTDYWYLTSSNLSEDAAAELEGVGGAASMRWKCAAPSTLASFNWARYAATHTGKKVDCEAAEEAERERQLSQNIDEY